MSGINEHRPLLFSIAYRMLGRVTEAEDMVQEAFLRWHRQEDVSGILEPRAWLTTTITDPFVSGDVLRGGGSPSPVAFDGNDRTIPRERGGSDDPDLSRNGRGEISGAIRHGIKGIEDSGCFCSQRQGTQSHRGKQKSGFHRRSYYQKLRAISSGDQKTASSVTDEPLVSSTGVYEH